MLVVGKKVEKIRKGIRWKGLGCQSEEFVYDLEGNGELWKDFMQGGYMVEVEF